MSPQLATIEAEAPSRSLARIAELDGIRGLAILPIIALHSGVSICPPGLVHNVVGLGWVGVDLFFVLSGFLITGILLDSKGDKDFFRRFYLRRVFRIFPIYYLYVVLFFLGMPLVWQFTGRLVSTINGRGDQLWYWLYLSNWRDAMKQNRLLWHFWSLSIEEQFYVVWPLVVYAASRRVLKYVCVALVILSPVLRFMALHEGISKYYIYSITVFRLEGLALGALLALASRDASLRCQIRRLAPFMWMAATAALIAVFSSSGTGYLTPAMAVYGYTSVAVLCGVFVSYGIERSGTNTRFARFLRQPWLVRFGKYSYGLYVWHMPIAEQVRKAGDQVRIRFGFSWMLLPLMLLIALAASYAAAWISWRFIEAPFARLKERLVA
jgi:peptidoglycan/LPS O-acetylase OafA/YrhL